MPWVVTRTERGGAAIAGTALGTMATRRNGPRFGSRSHAVSLGVDTLGARAKRAAIMIVVHDGRARPCPS